MYMLGAGSIPTIVMAVIKFLENRKALKENKPKFEAEAVDIGISSQGKALASLGRENERLAKRADIADAKVDAMDRRMQETLERARKEFEGRILEMQASFDQKIGQYHQENIQFKQRVESLLLEHSVALPDWWYDNA